uniref:Fibronectin type-III domain-containing protein n=1 Tax=Panagrellus redivivus TaxID=6233 RepID=A0A7E4VVM4_PANRE
MVQPYTLRLERAGSGGKTQLSVGHTMAHHLASKILLQKQPSLDDRRSIYTDNSGSEPGASDGLSRFVRRQGSVECTEKKRAPAFGQLESTLKRKIKNTMISVYGALTAIEQDDLDSLRMILSKNSVPINESLVESPLYSLFPCKVTLLDVALMLGRRGAAALLLQHEATENTELSDLQKRRQVVSEVLLEYEARYRQARDSETPTKDEEKRLRAMDHHLNSLKMMSAILERPELPGPPSEVRVHVTSSSTASVEYSAAGSTDSAAIITKYKIEWSTSPTFDVVDGEHIVFDVRESSATIRDLGHGQSYTFRVAAGNIFGFGEPVVAHPKNVKISSWEDLEDSPADRIEGMKSIFELNEQIERYRQSAVWQIVYPSTNDGAVKKKKLGLRNLFSASSKFIKNVGRGVYLASVIYTEDKVLCTVDDCLPVIQIEDECTHVSSEDVGWLMKLSYCWDQVGYLQDTLNAACSTSVFFKCKMLEAVAAMHNALGVKDIGRIHYIPLTQGSTTFIVTVHFLTENQAVQSQGLAMRWMKLNKLMRKKTSNAPLDFLNRELVNILNFFESSQIPLDRGLYLCYLKLQTSLNTIRITVPENLPSVLPFVTVRSNPHVSLEEWEWLRALDDEQTTKRPTPTQHTFHQQLIRASGTLLRDLELDSDTIANHRLYRYQVLQVHPDVSFILILPKVEDVCQVHAAYTAIDEYNDHCKGCSSLPVAVFEMISFATYQPDFIATYCRIDTFLEHFMLIINYEKRQCLSDIDAKVYTDLLEQLTEYQQKLEEIWRAARWISTTTTLARSRDPAYSISLNYVLNPPPPAVTSDDASDIGYHSDQGSSGKLNDTENIQKGVESVKVSRRRTTRGIISRSQSVNERAYLQMANIDQFFRHENTNQVQNENAETSIIQNENKRASNGYLQPTEASNRQLQRQEAVSEKVSMIIRVFPAFECALPNNTAIRLSITPLTTSREVVALVIEQINKISLQSDPDQLDLPNCLDYCLVSVIGARERRMRDEFPPMRLTPPWSRGRLYVRRCDEVSAAIHYGNESFV